MRKDEAMTSKELRKLSKLELVDMINEQNAVIEKLQLRVEQMEIQLKDRSLKIDQAGSLAEASLLVNGVIEAAQEAAQQYLDNIESLNERTTMLCMQQEEESNSRCRALEADTKKRCEELETSTTKKCVDLEKATDEKIEARWKEFTQKVDQYLDAHGELKEILKATVAPMEK